MKSSDHSRARARVRRRQRGVALVVAVALTAVGLVAAGSSSAAPIPPDLANSLDAGTSLVSTNLNGSPSAITTGTTPLAGFPTQGPSYMILSTGNAAGIQGGTTGTHLSVNLSDAASGADGNDLTQVTLQVQPPTGATCMAFDFAFLSEEYPEYVGSTFNDIFTAELNESEFGLDGNQVVAPNNFAFDSQGNPVSINTTFGMEPSTGTPLDGSTPPLSALTPVELPLGSSTMTVILSIQDLGDSIFDSAVLVDNIRWLAGANCERGVGSLEDTDGDALPDEWETSGIDYDGDGAPEVDLPAMGADPAVRDLFLEVDWMEKPKSCITWFCWGGKSFKPMQSALNDMVAAFAAAPGGPIRAHIDAGPDSVMNPVTGQKWGSTSRANQVPYVNALGTWGAGENYNWAAADAVRAANLDLPRADAFHYAVYADRFGSASTGYSGISRGIPGGMFIVSQGGFDDADFTRTQERGTVMHELGHNLDLYHGGGPTGTYQWNPVYKSIMNYEYQLTGIGAGAVLDYSGEAPYDDWANIRFDGGSIGDLGASDNEPAESVADSLTPEEAKAEGVYAKPGDGVVAFVGPGALVRSKGSQDLLFDITNVSTEPATYSLAITTDLPVGATAPVPVQPGQTVRVPVAVDTNSSSAGDHGLTAALSSDVAGADIATLTETIHVADPTAPGFEDEAAQIVAAIDSGQTDLDPQAAQSMLDQLDAPTDPTNSPPTIGSVSASTSGGPVDVTFSANDADDDDLTFSVTTPPSNGSVTGSGPTFTYTPAAGFSGADSFTVAVSDGQASASATATIEVDQDPGPTAPSSARLKIVGDTALEVSGPSDGPTIQTFAWISTVEWKSEGQFLLLGFRFGDAAEYSGLVVANSGQWFPFIAGTRFTFEPATTSVTGSWSYFSGGGGLSITQEE